MKYVSLICFLIPELLACPSSPCLNGATCFDRFDTADYLCICPTGYEGERCEIDIDYCAPEPCLNGATCVDQVEGYQCQCPPGWQGENCEEGNFNFRSLYLENTGKAWSYASIYISVSMYTWIARREL